MKTTLPRIVALIAFALDVASGQVQSRSVLEPIRSTAGEAHLTQWKTNRPLVSLVSGSTTPAIPFPIIVDLIAQGAKENLRIVVPPATPAGDYTIEVTGRDANAAPVSATLHVTVQAAQVSLLRTSRVPVVLLNGFQLSCLLSGVGSTINDSVRTFGDMAYLLQNESVPVAFFNNCMYGDVSIEALATQLGNYINTLTYPDGTQVAQVDLVVHSMGGLIARAHLAGKGSAPGNFSPPLNPKVGKLVTIATPHFGAFKAPQHYDVQASELQPASQFIWDLATWNQRSDDLRGIDALAVIGNAAPYPYGSLQNASDGVVSLSSGSLEFSRPGHTRILNYCHVSADSYLGLAGLVTGCPKPGIVDSITMDPTHPTYQIVSSFLADGTAWQRIGNSPAQDQWLSRYGGMVAEEVEALGNPVLGLSGVSFGTVGLSHGGTWPEPAWGELFYGDFVSGTGIFTFGPSSTCGPYTEIAGSYSTVRCKFSPVIYSVGPLLPVAGKVVQAGTTITISGAGFGAQQCATCGVTAWNPQSAGLQISSWTDTTIRAVLPASFGIGIATIGVTTATGYDAINIMAATAAAPPTISLTSNHLQFSYTTGGTTPAPQTVGVTNAGGGVLNWTATSNALWLAISTSSAGIAAFIRPASLAPGTYTGTIAVTASGATNSPQTVQVTLTVSAPAVAPSISLSSTQLQFAYTQGGATPTSKTITVSNAGGGNLSWAAASNVSWLQVTTSTSTLTASVTPASLAPGTYNGSIAVTASGASNTPQTIALTLTITAAALPVISLSTNQLQFAYTLGGATPAAKNITVSNTGGGVLTWSAASNASWLQVSISGSTLGASVNPAGLSTGNHSGSITVTAVGASNTPQSIAVSLTVAAAAAPPAISLSTSQLQFTVTVGGATPVQTITANNSGGGQLSWTASTTTPWIQLSTSSNTITVAVSPNGMAPGLYNGSISVASAGASNTPQLVSVALTIGQTSSTLVISSVTNGASGAGGAIAPGEVIAIAGSGLGPSRGLAFEDDPQTGTVPTTLGNTRVLFGTLAAPVTYASGNLVLAVVPYEVAGQSSVVLTVQYQRATSAGKTLQVAAASPGVYCFADGQAVALNADGTINEPSNPAAKGSTVTVYFTGGGRTSPAGVTGAINGTSQKALSQKAAVSVGGQFGVVSYAGAAPNVLEGVLEAKVQLSGNTPTGAALPLVITVGGTSSSVATLAVQ